MRNQLKQMTPEEIAEEDAYAERCFQESKNITRERAREILSQHRRSPAYGFSVSSPRAAALEKTDIDKAAEDLMGNI